MIPPSTEERQQQQLIKGSFPWQAVRSWAVTAGLIITSSLQASVSSISAKLWGMIRRTITTIAIRILSINDHFLSIDWRKPKVTLPSTLPIAIVGQVHYSPYSEWDPNENAIIYPCLSSLSSSVSNRNGVETRSQESVYSVDRVPHSLYWAEMNFSVPAVSVAAGQREESGQKRSDLLHDSSSTRKLILKQCWGYAKSGQLCAIFGPSGKILKSILTFINILSVIHVIYQLYGI